MSERTVQIYPYSFQPDKESILPRIRFAIGIRVKEPQVVLNAEGAVFSEDKKFLAHLDRIPKPSSPNIALRATQQAAAESFQTYDFELAFVLDNKSLKHIEELRQRNPRHVVNLEFRVLITYLTCNLRHDYKTSADQLTVADANNLFTFEYLSVSLVWSILRDDWDLDFSPTLGLASYEILELPVLAGGSAKFSEVIECIRQSQDQLRVKLNSGAAISALRNALDKFYEGLKELKLAADEPDSQGKQRRVIHWKAILTDDCMSENVKSIHEACRDMLNVGPDASAPHLSSSSKLEGFQIASIIAFVSYLVKLTFDSINASRQVEQGA